jgi:hypothetical protein
MKNALLPSRHLAAIFGLTLTLCLQAQNPPPPPGGGGPGFGGPGGGRGGGFGGFGPPGTQPDRELVHQFDKDRNKVLDAEERQAAYEFLQKEQAEGRGPRGFGGRGRGGSGGRGGNQSPPQPGPKLTPAEVKRYGEEPLYDSKVLRTLFLEFENANWEKELIAFNNTDIEVPAKLMVDGKAYPDVGVHFRGASSFFSVGEGRKHSINLSLDFVHKEQNLLGYRTLNLLNCNGDPSLLRAVLYQRIAAEYTPVPKGNFVRVVINGESWGIYPSVQQFNKEFTRDFFGTTKGARWKVPGSPNGRGTLAYLGDDPEAYKSIYTIKTKDSAKDWKDFINLCKTLNETPPDRLEKALEPLLDVDGALKFLALEIVLVNNDGYWARGSDYNIYMDEERKFHIIAHDTNETFMRPGGPGFGGRGGGRGGFGGPPGGPGFGGPPPGAFEPGGPGGLPPNRQGGPGEGGNPVAADGQLDPLGFATRADRPLISKLLAVPALRTRYLGYVRDIADKWLDWKTLGPVAREYHDLIADDVRKDTRKLDSTEAFNNSLAQEVEGGGLGGGPGRTPGLKNFADARRAYLLDHPDIKKLAK